MNTLFTNINKSKWYKVGSRVCAEQACWWEVVGTTWLKLVLTSPRQLRTDSPAPPTFLRSLDHCSPTRFMCIRRHKQAYSTHSKKWVQLLTSYDAGQIYWFVLKFEILFRRMQVIMFIAKKLGFIRCSKVLWRVSDLILLVPRLAVVITTQIYHLSEAVIRITCLRSVYWSVD